MNMDNLQTLIGNRDQQYMSCNMCLAIYILQYIYLACTPYRFPCPYCSNIYLALYILHVHPIGSHVLIVAIYILQYISCMYTQQVPMSLLQQYISCNIYLACTPNRFPCPYCSNIYLAIYILHVHPIGSHVLIVDNIYLAIYILHVHPIGFHVLIVAIYILQYISCMYTQQVPMSLLQQYISCNIYLACTPNRFPCPYCSNIYIAIYILQYISCMYNPIGFHVLIVAIYILQYISCMYTQQVPMSLLQQYISCNIYLACTPNRFPCPYCSNIYLALYILHVHPIGSHVLIVAIYILQYISCMYTQQVPMSLLQQYISCNIYLACTPNRFPCPYCSNIYLAIYILHVHPIGFHVLIVAIYILQYISCMYTQQVPMSLLQQYISCNIYLACTPNRFPCPYCSNIYIAIYILQYISCMYTQQVSMSLLQQYISCNIYLACTPNRFPCPYCSNIYLAIYILHVHPIGSHVLIVAIYILQYISCMYTQQVPMSLLQQYISCNIYLALYILHVHPIGSHVLILALNTANAFEYLYPQELVPKFSDL